MGRSSSPNTVPRRAITEDRVVFIIAAVILPPALTALIPKMWVLYFVYACMWLIAPCTDRIFGNNRPQFVIRQLLCGAAIAAVLLISHR